MGLFENMKTETVSRLNLREPVLATADQKVREVVQAMRQRNLGCAILVDGDNKPIGMFTESMLTQIIANQPELLDASLGEQAADHWAQISLSDPITAVLEALEVKNTRFLSVVDDEGRVAGLAGQKGLMEYIADHFPREVMVQRVGQKPCVHHREGA